MTLLLMLEFFEHNDIAPTETLGPKTQTMEGLIKKINGDIAKLKDIEKTQTKLTAAMLMALLKQTEPIKKPLILENNNFRADKEIRIPEYYTRIEFKII